MIQEYLKNHYDRADFEPSTKEEFEIQEKLFNLKPISLGSDIDLDSGISKIIHSYTIERVSKPYVSHSISHNELAFMPDNCLKFNIKKPEIKKNQPIKINFYKTQLLKIKI